MKKYFIDNYITYCYPHEVKHIVKNYGVLSKYMGKQFDRDEADKIICELITRHPYIDNSMALEFRIMREDKNIEEFYQTVNIRNDNYKKQSKGNLEIKYEK